MVLLVRGISQLVSCVGSHMPRCGEDAGELAIIENGAVIIEDGLIGWIGPESDLPANIQPDMELDAEHRLVTPGLVDPHTHALFAGSREKELFLRLLTKCRGQWPEFRFASTLLSSHSDWSLL